MKGVITHEFFDPERPELCTERRITPVSILAKFSLSHLLACRRQVRDGPFKKLSFLKITLLLQNTTVD